MITMPSSPIETPMLPPDPVSMYTVPATFVVFTSILLKSRSWATAMVAYSATMKVILRMMGFYPTVLGPRFHHPTNRGTEDRGTEDMKLPDDLQDAISQARAKVHLRYPWWLRVILMRGVVAITIGRRIYVAADVAEQHLEQLLRHELVHVR